MRSPRLGPMSRMRQRRALRRHHHHADQGDQHTNNLHQCRARPVHEERAGQHHDRDRALQDADVDGGGVVAGRVEQRIEACEAEEGHQRYARQPRPDLAPMLAHLPAVQRPQHGQHHHPAQEHQQERGDVSHRQAAGERIARPEYRRQRQQHARPLIQPVQQPARGGAHGDRLSQCRLRTTSPPAARLRRL